MLLLLHFSVTQVRQSRYDKRYLEPTHRPDDLQEPLADTDPRRFHPIKAATKDQTSSIVYDELVRCAL